MSPINVEDDPKFPVKPTVSAVSAIVAWAATQNLDSPWQQLITLAALFLGGYIPPNPKRVKRS